MRSTMSISVASDRHCRYMHMPRQSRLSGESVVASSRLSVPRSGRHPFHPICLSAFHYPFLSSFLPPSLPLPFDDEQWETLSLHFTISAVQHKAAQQPTRSLAQPVEKREIVNMRIMDVCQVVRILAHYVNRISSKRRAAKLRGAFRGRCSLATAALCRPFLSLNQSNPNKKLS